MSPYYFGDILTDAGLANTSGRRQLLIRFRQDRTWSASQLSVELAVDLSTIYRNLKHFEDVGLIETVFERGGETIYEHANRKHHDHAICKSCETPRCVPCPISGSKPHILQLFETCASCK